MSKEKLALFVWRKLIPSHQFWIEYREEIYFYPILPKNAEPLFKIVFDDFWASTQTGTNCRRSHTLKS